MRKWTFAVALVLLTVGSSYAGPFGLFGRNRVSYAAGDCGSAAVTCQVSYAAAPCGGCTQAAWAPVQWQAGCQQCSGGCQPVTTWQQTFPQQPQPSWQAPQQQQQAPLLISPNPNYQPPANQPGRMPAGSVTMDVGR
jgi:hypothetical protein